MLQHQHREFDKEFSCSFRTISPFLDPPFPYVFLFGLVSEPLLLFGSFISFCFFLLLFVESSVN